MIDGPEDGPLVVLLHGFPEFSYGWRKQIPALVARGYRVVAPDQRGYNESSKPSAVADYSLDALSLDIVGLIDAMGRKTAHVVGHDWGAAVAWWMAVKHRERVETLTVINVPHPLVMRRHLLGKPKQMAKSWYMFFFQLPFVPESLIARNNFEGFAKMIVESARPGAFTADDIAVYKEAWRKPGALTGMIAWYRAIRSQIAQQISAEDARIRMPALVIWGKQDHLLGSEMAAPSVGFCDRGKLAMIEDATHWVHHEEPDRVNALILEHLGR